ncbi:MAG: recombination protein RecR [Gammaproteobacteria bacterium TMED180]|nr:MAG: recombination protein RecR [Gammaproteobacteria bacterium TMED180]|tara:strand:- start:443 stop:1039 length:597 start_codon:yes stop_codon:yes gene_type:complete
MKNFSLFDQTVEAFRCLPGVGSKTAQRMLLHLLERDRTRGELLVRLLGESLEKIKNCALCRNISETELCEICRDQRRDKSMLCVVESPSDVIAIEQASAFNGLYFVLSGTLSPIEGRGGEEIGVPDLIKRCQENISEVIVAVSSTVEGEATSFFLFESLRHSNIKISRIAQGVPRGGELELVDGLTLSHAFEGRQNLE